MSAVDGQLLLLCACLGALLFAHRVGRRASAAAAQAREQFRLARLALAEAVNLKEKWEHRHTAGVSPAAAVEWRRKNQMPTFPLVINSAMLAVEMGSIITEVKAWRDRGGDEPFPANVRDRIDAAVAVLQARREAVL